jgi:CBS-domain-containing membrane protein
MGEDYHAPAIDEPRSDASAPAHVVSDLMRRDVPSVLADAPIGEVLDAVTSTRLNRTIVIDADRRVLGVVTDADLLAKLDPTGEAGILGALMGRDRGSVNVKASARDVMNSPATTVAADTPVTLAINKMLREHRKVVAITDAEGRLLGAVDRADLLHHMIASSEAQPPGR